MQHPSGIEMETSVWAQYRKMLLAGGDWDDVNVVNGLDHGSGKRQR